MTQDGSDEAATGSSTSENVWTRPRAVTYPLVAAVAFPPLLLATALLLYRDFSRIGAEAAPARAAGSALPVHHVPEPNVAPVATSLPSGTAGAFDEIYRAGLWGRNDAGVGTSGSGSTLASTLPYRSYLQAFLKEHEIRSVVDVGCGDWEFSRSIDWSGIDYKGYDIVESVIARDKAKYEAANVHFFTANIVTDELPAADLVIAKHVLQHLPNADVVKFLGRLGNYKHALLTNGVHPVSLTAGNEDIVVGDFRLLDPTQPPFRVRGKKVLTWWDGGDMHQVVHVVRPSAGGVTPPSR